MTSVLVKNQEQNINVTVSNSKLYPEFNGKNLKIQIRYDDDCGNGHNSFSITGSCGGNRGISGCIHDFITEQMPELKKYIKWHLTSSDGPMHYVANSMYHAKEVKPNTIPRSYEERLQFDNIPFTFNLTRRLKEFIENHNLTTVEVIALKHPDNGIEHKYQYSDNYTFKGMQEKWYESLFNNEREAEEMANALMSHSFTIKKTVSSYESEKIPNLNHARSSAIWHDARLEDFTEEKLLERLPKLLEDFRNDIEELGLVY